MNLKIVFLTIIAIANKEINGIEWNGDWALNCDFLGNDFKSLLSSGELCSTMCSQEIDCTHYTWTEHNGGTCWLKFGKACKKDAVHYSEGASVCGIVKEDCTTDSILTKGELLWSDEFDYSGPPKTSRWTAEIGGHGWGNNEKQYYTNNENAFAKNGYLEIETRKENRENNKYTSARIISKKSFKYGIFEMRAKLPTGKGIWSAFWMLSAKRPLNWPTDGEIDIMENVGFDPSGVHANIHTGKFNHQIGTNKGGMHILTSPSDEYHTYSIDWSPSYIKAYVDGINFFTYYKTDPSFGAWPFDTDFNIILNVAVGGGWASLLGMDDSIYPTKYHIDHVRQYQNGHVKV